VHKNQCAPSYSGSGTIYYSNNDMICKYNKCMPKIYDDLINSSLIISFKKYNNDLQKILNSNIEIGGIEQSSFKDFLPDKIENIDGTFDSVPSLDKLVSNIDQEKRKEIEETWCKTIDNQNGGKFKNCNELDEFMCKSEGFVSCEEKNRQKNNDINNNLTNDNNYNHYYIGLIILCICIIIFYFLWQ
jgi:hypothetical protein